MIMEAKRNIVFSAAVWVAYVLVFAVQKPFFLFYNRDVWTEMSAFDWGQAFVSGLLFDVLLAACFALFPVLLTFLRSRLSERAAEGVLRVYFLGTALYIAAVFAFSGVLFESTILKTVLFIGYAAAIVGLCWEKVVPLFGRIGARRRTERRVSLLLAGMLLFFFGGVAFGNRSLSEHYASRITCTSILTTSRSLFGINSVRSGNVSRDGRYFPDSPAGSAEAFFFDFCCLFKAFRSRIRSIRLRMLRIRSANVSKLCRYEMPIPLS